MIGDGSYCEKEDEDQKNIVSEASLMADKRDEMVNSDDRKGRHRILEITSDKQIHHKGNTVFEGRFPFTQNVSEPIGAINKQGNNVCEGNLPLFKQNLGEQIRAIIKKRNNFFKGNIPFKMDPEKVCHLFFQLKSSSSKDTDQKVPHLFFEHLFFSSELPSGPGGIDPNRTAELFKQVLVAVDAGRDEKEHCLAPFSIRPGYLDKSMDRRQRVGLLYGTRGIGSRYTDCTDGIHLIEIDRVLVLVDTLFGFHTLQTHGFLFETKIIQHYGVKSVILKKISAGMYCYDKTKLLFGKKPSNKDCYTSRSHRSGPLVSEVGHDVELQDYHPLETSIGGAHSRFWILFKERPKWPSFRVDLRTSRFSRQVVLIRTQQISTTQLVDKPVSQTRETSVKFPPKFTAKSLVTSREKVAEFRLHIILGKSHLITMKIQDGANFVLGIQWLATLNSVKANWKEIFLRFDHRWVYDVTWVSQQLNGLLLGATIR